MSRFLDFNASRGTWYEYDYDHDEDKAYVTIKQDSQPVLDLAKIERNSGINDKVGDFSKYAMIPAAIEVELKRKWGIDMYDQNQTQELLRVINKHYPHLKTTNLTHDIKNSDL